MSNTSSNSVDEVLGSSNDHDVVVLMEVRLRQEYQVRDFNTASGNSIEEVMEQHRDTPFVGTTATTTETSGTNNVTAPASGSIDGGRPLIRPSRLTPRSSVAPFTARPPPVIDSDLRFNTRNSLLFCERLTSICSSWTPEYVAQHGISLLLRLLADKIFSDNLMRFNLFMLDATICPTCSDVAVWVGPGTRVDFNSSGVRFRTFFQAGGRPYVLHLFDYVGLRQPSFSIMKFTLEYMHSKFHQGGRQLVPEIFARAAGSFQVGREMVVLKSPTGEEYKYPKTYSFYSDS